MSAYLAASGPATAGRLGVLAVAPAVAGSSETDALGAMPDGSVRDACTFTNGREPAGACEATSDTPTIVTPISHSYLELSGEGSGRILDEQLMLDGLACTPVDTTPSPTAIGARVRVRDGGRQEAPPGQGPRARVPAPPRLAEHAGAPDDGAAAGRDPHDHPEPLVHDRSRLTAGRQGGRSRAGGAVE
jgi:hypothetical protein